MVLKSNGCQWQEACVHTHSSSNTLQLFCLPEQASWCVVKMFSTLSRVWVFLLKVGGSTQVFILKCAPSSCTSSLSLSTNFRNRILSDFPGRPAFFDFLTFCCAPSRASAWNPGFTSCEQSSLPFEVVVLKRDSKLETFRLLHAWSKQCFLKKYGVCSELKSHLSFSLSLSVQISDQHSDPQSSSVLYTQWWTTSPMREHIVT